MFSQQFKIDTIYTDDAKIDGYGQINDSLRIGTWRFSIYGDKSYKTITYIDSSKGIVKFFDDNDCYEQIQLNNRAVTNKIIKNNTFYLKKYAEILVKHDYSWLYNGWQVIYYPNGVPYSEGYYKNGYRIGEWKIWYYNGYLGNKLNYNNYGNLDSVFISYYENGQMMFVGNYKDNARIGLWKEYYQNGILKSEGKFCEDISPIYVNYENVDSVQKLFPELIQDTIFVNYTLDFKSGKWKYYNEAGILIREELYKNGKLIDN